MNLIDALNAPTAIVGTTGAGKTFAAKGAVEELLQLGRRVVVIDPTGAWWGVRSGADGDAAGGFPVTIFGGDHGDIPISDTAGARLAEAIAGREVQAIIDVSEMTGGEKTRFLTDFLQTLYAKNKAALYLVVDEADEVCPQNPMPEERRLSGAFDKIVRRGRIKGFRPLMITQRPAVLHKNVLSQIGTLIALKLTSPQDRKAIDDWVKGNADTGEAAKVMKSLPTLPRGEGWLWSPAAGVLERRQFPAITTFDSSRTPGADEAVVEPPLSAVDVEALREAMEVAPEPSAKPGKASAADLAAAEERGYQRGLAEGIERGKSQGIALGITRAQQALAALRIPDIASEPIGASPRAEIDAPAEPMKARQRVPAAERAAPGDALPGEPGSAALSMLDTLVEAYPSALTASLWGAFSGRSPVSGPWHKAVGELRAAGLIVGDQNGFTATTDGVKRATTTPANIGSQIEIWSHWRVTIRAKLGAAAVDMLQTLAAHRPNQITARQWGLLTNRSPVSGPWHAAVRDLIKWECVEKIGDAFAVTDKGVQIAGVDGGTDTAAKLTEIRIGRLSGLALQIYDALPGDRADLAKRLGKSPISGPWHAAVKELLASGLAGEADKILLRIDEPLRTTP